MTAFIGQVILEAISTASVSLLVVERAGLVLRIVTQIHPRRVLFGSLFCKQIQLSTPLHYLLTAFAIPS